MSKHCYCTLIKSMNQYILTCLGYDIMLNLLLAQYDKLWNTICDIWHLDHSRQFNNTLGYTGISHIFPMLLVYSLVMLAVPYNLFICSYKFHISPDFLLHCLILFHAFQMYKLYFLSVVLNCYLCTVSKRCHISMLCNVLFMSCQFISDCYWYFYNPWLIFQCALYYSAQWSREHHYNTVTCFEVT